MRVQHLQQQVIQRNFVLALHAVQVFHPFIASRQTERYKHVRVKWNGLASSSYGLSTRSAVLPHVSDVREQKQELGLTPGLELHRDSRLADVVYEGIRDVIHHALHHEAIPQGLDGGGAERKRT